MKTLEQLKSEAREKYRNLPNFKTLPKENQEVILENNDTLITIAFNAGLERAVEVVEDRPTVEDCQKLVDDGYGEWATKEEINQVTGTDKKIYPT